MSTESRLLDCGGAGERVDATGPVTPVQSVVALLAPALAPAVLDDPVRHLLLEQREVVLPEPHDEDAVVDPVRAAEELEGVTDSSLVELHSIGIETDRDGAVLQEPLSHLGLILADLDPAGDPGGHLGPVELAGLVHTVVAVVGLSLQPADLQESLRGQIVNIKMVRWCLWF